MSGSVNKCFLLGNVGRDPEVRRMQNGDAVVSFSVATTEAWKDKTTGERKESVTWHNIVIFNDNLGKVAEQYVRKGSKIYLEGQLQNREYTDKDGNQRRVTEVVLQRFRGELTLLDGPKDDRQPAGRPDEPTRVPPRSNRPSASAARHSAPGDFDDDIPFAPEWR